MTAALESAPVSARRVSTWRRWRASARSEPRKGSRRRRRDRAVQVRCVPSPRANTGTVPPRSASVAGGVVHVYIAAPLTLLRDAKRAAALLAEDQECEVVSSWHAGAPTVEAERALSPDEATELAERCLREVERCDVLLLLYGPRPTGTRSIWEAAGLHELGELCVPWRLVSEQKLPPSSCEPRRAPACADAR